MRVVAPAGAAAGAPVTTPVVPSENPHALHTTTRPTPGPRLHWPDVVVVVVILGMSIGWGWVAGAGAAWLIYARTHRWAEHR